MADSKNIKVRIALDGSEEFKKGLNDIGAAGQQAAQKLEQAFKDTNLGKNVADAVGKANTAFQAFGKNAAAVGVAVGRVAAAFTQLGIAAVAAGAAAAPVLAKLGVSAINAADGIDKAAKAAGASTQDFQKMSFAAANAGVGQDTFAGALNSVQKALQEFQGQGLLGKLANGLSDTDVNVRNSANDFGRLSGVVVDGVKVFNDAGIRVRSFGAAAKDSGAATSDFGKIMTLLGATFDPVSGKINTSTQAFGKLADAFKAMKEGPAKTALGIKLFGEAFAELEPLLNKGSAGLKDAEGVLRKYGLALTDAEIAQAKIAKTSFTALGDSFERLKNVIGVEFAPALTAASDGLTNFIRTNAPALKTFTRDSVEGATRAVNDFFDAFASGKSTGSFGSFLGSQIRELSDLFGSLNDKGKSLGDTFGAAAGKIGSSLSDAFGKVKEAGGTAFDGVVNIVSTDVGRIQELLSRIGGTDAFKAVQGAATTAWQTIRDGAGQLVGYLGGAFTGPLESIKSAFESISGVLDGIIAKAQKAIDAISRATANPNTGGTNGDSVGTAENRPLGLATQDLRPSTEIEDRRPGFGGTGLDSVTGDVQTAMQTIQEVVQQGLQVIQEAITTFGQTINGVWSGFSEAASTAFSDTSNIVSQGVQNIAQGLQGIPQAFANAFAGVGDAVRGALDGVAQAVTQIVSNIGAQLDQLQQRINAVINSAQQAKSATDSASGGSGFASGGIISGPGTGTSDSILARVSTGEFVQRAAAVKYYSPTLMHAINQTRIPAAALWQALRGGMERLDTFRMPAFNLGGMVGNFDSPTLAFPRFANGGLVQNFAPATVAASPTLPMVRLDLHLGGQSIGKVDAPKDVADKLTKFVRQVAPRSAGRLPSWYQGG